MDILGTGKLQVQLLRAMWANPVPHTVKDFELALNTARDRPLAFTTILTVARGLAKRGLVMQVRGQRRHTFVLAVTKEEFYCRAVEEFAAHFFDSMEELRGRI